ADPPIEDDDFAAVVDIFEPTLREYEPSRGLGDWKENAAITSLLLAPSSPTRQLLTVTPVARVAALSANWRQLRRLVLRGCRVVSRALQSTLHLLSAPHSSALQRLGMRDKFLAHGARRHLCDMLNAGRTSLVELNVAFNRL
ncbi:ribonuclease inhibitor, partial [Trypanosoma grayi]|uniref:ribonuclease inhibitor n=1 Tax=Trypanosoma grayi TaxID=71804 RepID=UPI0004F3EFCB